MDFDVHDINSQGIKGKLCRHTLALVYDRNKDFPVDPRLDAVRFTRKRKVGRPKALGSALTRETPLVVVNGQLQQPGYRGAAVPGGDARPEVGGGDPLVAAIPKVGGGDPLVAAIPASISNNWSSLPMILGNVQVTDSRLQLQPGTSRLPGPQLPPGPPGPSAEPGTSSAEDDVEELTWDL